MIARAGQSTILTGAKTLTVPAFKHPASDPGGSFVAQNTINRGSHVTDRCGAGPNPMMTAFPGCLTGMPTCRRVLTIDIVKLRTAAG